MKPPPGNRNGAARIVVVVVILAQDFLPLFSSTPTSFCCCVSTCAEMFPLRRPSTLRWIAFRRKSILKVGQLLSTRKMSHFDPVRDEEEEEGTCASLTLIRTSTSSFRSRRPPPLLFPQRENPPSLVVLIKWNFRRSCSGCLFLFKSFWRGWEKGIPADSEGSACCAHSTTTPD